MTNAFSRINPAGIVFRPSGLSAIELTGIGAELRDRLVRGMLVNAAGERYSLKPVVIGDRFGFVCAAPERMHYLPPVKFYAQIDDGTIGRWTLPAIDLVNAPLGLPEIVMQANPLPQMCPDYSRVPLSLGPEDIWGVSLENWMWMPDMAAYSRMVAGHGLTAIARMLGGSSDTPDRQECTGVWFYDIYGIQPYVLEAIAADRAAGVESLWWLQSGNNGVIQSARFDDNWMAMILHYFEDEIGPAGVALGICSEPWHPKGAAAREKVLRWEMLASSIWTGKLFHNWSEDRTGQIRVDHHQHPKSFIPGTVREGDSPGVIDWITNGQPQGFSCPERVYEDACVSKRNRCGYLLYDYRWDAWKPECWDHAGLEAVGKARVQG